MKYEVNYSKQFDKSMGKLKKKNKELYKRIKTKIREIISHPEHFKPLRNELAGCRRTHFGPFVLVFEINENEILIIALDHHDKAY